MTGTKAIRKSEGKMNKKACCGNCKYWECQEITGLLSDDEDFERELVAAEKEMDYILEESGLLEKRDEPEDTGWCKRHPPSASFGMVPSCFPETSRSQLCGEHAWIDQ